MIEDLITVSFISDLIFDVISVQTGDIPAGETGVTWGDGTQITSGDGTLETWSG